MDLIKLNLMPTIQGISHPPNSSITAFRHLLDQLRERNQSQNVGTPLSNSSIKPSHSNEDISIMVSQSPLQDSPIKLKPKAIMNAKILFPTAIHSLQNSKNSLPVIHSKSRSIVTDKTDKSKSRVFVQGSRSQTCRRFSIDRSSVNIQDNNQEEAFLEGENQQIKQKIVHSSDIHQIEEHQQIKVATKEKILQRRFNLTVINNLSLFKMNPQHVIEYFHEEQSLTHESSPEQIFQFFNKLLEQNHVFIGTPSVKKYKNCVYFGEEQQGVLYYFTNRVYYGGFINGQKNGEGVDIQLFSQQPRRQEQVIPKKPAKRQMKLEPKVSKTKGL